MLFKKSKTISSEIFCLKFKRTEFNILQTTSFEEKKNMLRCRGETKNRFKEGFKSAGIEKIEQTRI